MKYLARLISEKRPPLVLPKLLKAQTQLLDELPKLPKPPFSSYSSMVGRHILKNDSVSNVIDPVKDIPKTEKASAPEPQKGGGDSPLPFYKESIVSCFTCHHYDGTGPAWPGMCRYFETIGEPAKEIDFDMVDPTHGCKCYKVCAVAPELVSSIKRQRLRGDDPGYIMETRISEESPKLGTPVRSLKLRSHISPVASSWLQEHRQALHQAGWTGQELYRRNKSKGICWCALWNAPFLKVYLHDDGVIEFEAVIACRDIIQTARPMHQTRTILGAQTI